jgi:sugar lactone lactonase YvrE
MTGKAELFSDSRSMLGEGPFWHPLLGRLFWFDIANHTLLSAGDEGNIVDRITFRDTVSAAAVIDRETLAVAQAGALLRYDFGTDTSSTIVEIEPGDAGNRTNDGRANFAGGFWIGTMRRSGGDGRKGAGAVYQYRNGVLTTVLDGITTPNSICFTEDGRTAYFADTPTGVIRRCSLDPATGLPAGPWEDFAAPEAMGRPDGAVVDTEGYVWSARWDGSCVIRFAPDGSIDQVVELPVSRVTCPAFGGDDFRTLYVTSARQGMTDEELKREPHAGSVFAIELDVPGFPDPGIAI